MFTMTEAASADYRRDLGDGLILRWSTGDDTEKIAHLVAHVFRVRENDPPNENLQNAVRRLMSGKTTVMGPGDYGLIEDTSKEGCPVVACVCLERQEWDYEGITFAVGRPEIVDCDPTYRNRGLIRSIFSMVHARSEAEGHMVQAITGIPYFYRQFGYEFALDLGGKRNTYLSLIPSLKEGENDPYTLREATIEDIPTLQQLYKHDCSRYMLSARVSDEYWRFLIEGGKDDPVLDRGASLQLILNADGQVQGFFMSANKRWSKEHWIGILAFEPHTNMQTMALPLLRLIKAHAEQLPAYKPDTEALSELAFYLGRSHPFYEVLGDALAPKKEAPYAWYIRVPDLARFINHIAPVLEKRLINSPIEGFTGELKVDMYRDGLRVVFEQGRITTAEHWDRPFYEANANAGFPPLVFLQLVFGHRSLDELRHAFPDVWSNNDVLLNTLFPAKTSWTIALD